MLQIKVYSVCRSRRILLRRTIFTAKALYRRGLAHVILKEDEEAERDFSEAVKLVPDDQQVKAELTKVKERQKEKRDKEKKAYKKMFS